MGLMKILKTKYGKINNVRSSGLLSKSDKINSVQSSGLLSKSDILILKNIKNKPPSSHRKGSYIKWKCTDCEKEYFYKVISCLLCESRNINEIALKTQYQSAFVSSEDASNSQFDESRDKKLNSELAE